MYDPSREKVSLDGERKDNMTKPYPKTKIFRVAAWPLLLIFMAYFFQINASLGASSKVEEKDLSAPSSSPENSASVENSTPEQPKRGGIFKVGQAFKKVGGGIKKGMVATGRAFKKAGTAVKNTFTGKSSEPETRPSMDGGLDHVGDETGPPKSGNGASS